MTIKVLMVDDDASMRRLVQTVCEETATPAAWVPAGKRRWNCSNGNGPMSWCLT